MGCLEKVLGTLLGLLFIASGIYFIIHPEEGDFNFSRTDCIFIIANGGFWTLLNLVTSYESFESWFNQLFQSPITTMIGKWLILALFSWGITWVAVGLICGFDTYSFWTFAKDNVEAVSLLS